MTGSEFSNAIILVSLIGASSRLRQYTDPSFVPKNKPFFLHQWINFPLSFFIEKKKKYAYIKFKEKKSIKQGSS